MKSGRGIEGRVAKEMSIAGGANGESWLEEDAVAAAILGMTREGGEASRGRPTVEHEDE